MWYNVLRIKRKKLGMTRKALAEMVGCHVDTLRDWERGKHKPRAYYIDNLCEALNLREEVFDDD